MFWSLRYTWSGCTIWNAHEWVRETIWKHIMTTMQLQIQGDKNVRCPAKKKKQENASLCLPRENGVLVFMKRHKNEVMQDMGQCTEWLSGEVDLCTYRYLQDNYQELQIIWYYLETDFERRSRESIWGGSKGSLREDRGPENVYQIWRQRLCFKPQTALI